MISDADSIDEESLAAARLEMNSPPPVSQEYVLACKLGDIPKNGSRGKVIFCEHDEVAIFRFGEKVYAISNICPHQASPLLSEGYVDKEELTVACPLHGWTYSIATGRSVVGDSSVTIYDVRIEGEE